MTLTPKRRGHRHTNNIIGMAWRGLQRIPCVLFLVPPSSPLLLIVFSPIHEAEQVGLEIL